MDGLGARQGLRERKKAQTRAAIQDAALRLFREQGYATTTVEQIAAAAEVSERTFFRYFPTKADTVLYDRTDPLLAVAFLAQPAALGPTAAFRGALRDVFATLPSQDLEAEQERQRIVAQVDELQAVRAENVQATMSLFAGVLAQRCGRPRDDPRVRAWVGAVSGIAISSYLAWAADTDGRGLVELFDEGLGLLEAGLPL